MSKASRDLKSLANWFERQKRILPWRENPSVYRVWISEIMLQQTQVITVIPYFERFISRFPDVESLANASFEEVLLHWAGLGYYSRARNLHRAAKIIAQRQIFPSSREEWLEIPGVGEYTAGAILSIAENQVEPILDGNVERVLSRFHCISREKGDQKYKDVLWSYARKAVEQGHSLAIKPSVTNQALMELGATVCTPKNPKCETCPVSLGCQAHRDGKQESFPPKKKPKEWVRIEESLFCILRGGSTVQVSEVLLRFRKKGEWRSGLWDLLEEIPKSLVKNSTRKVLGKIETKHVVTRHKIHRVTEVSKIKGTHHSLLTASDDSDLKEYRWVSLDCPEVPLGSAARKTLEAARGLLQ
ncbi:MAG: A/G-specific adenine glycosylase [Bdellovibrio sp.]|nr:A/G-specific adenine glycosylase [Bdellovibrio sp.]